VAVALSEREQTRARYPDETGYVERDGVRVFWEAYGSGEPAFLLLPTWSIIHSRQWTAQIPFLAREGRVVTFDGRGSGRSDRPTDPSAYDEREFALDALAVLDATGTDRAIVVGYSLGTPRGLILVAEQPERVAGAVFIGAQYPGGGEPLPERVMPWEDELDTDEGWAKYNRHYWLRDFRGFLEFFFRRFFTEPHSTKQIEDCVGWGLETTPETLIETFEALTLCRVERFRETCARVRCPVLVIHGVEDAVRPHSQGAALAELTGGQLVLLEGSGHGPHARDPVKVNLLIRKFVESLARRAT
jgi:pimeloyl-ACP methyl ester carboxylesterase